MEPGHGMKMRLDRVWARSPGPQRTVAVRHALRIIPMTARYVLYRWKLKRRNKMPIMDFISLEESKQIYGCPLGGIGTGSIGRGFKGEFCRFQLRPGIYEHTTVPEDQFIINIKDNKNDTIYQSVLSAYTKPKKSPASWEWNLNGKDCEYTALYPQAWTTYDLSKYGVKLICKQISPVIPHNYKDSSLPCAVFLWDVVNVCSEPRHVSITFTFCEAPNKDKKREDKVNFERYCDNYTCGVTMEQKISDMSCTFTVAKKKQSQDSTVDGFCKFNTKKTANCLWDSLKSHGRVMPDAIPVDKHLPNAMGLSSQIVLEAGCKDRLEFCLVWDMPVVHFGNKTRTYNRYYTKFFGNEGIAGPNIATYALMSYKKWEQDIDEWQSPILEDENLPDWFKSALMNELYYISDGGTVWFDVSDQYPKDDPRWLYGTFAYLEGHEYRMYNTYDVHFYASFALAQLWPNLQVSLQYQFKETTLKSITTSRKYLSDGKTTDRKLIDSVPHDLGDPYEEPFILHNAYNIHDVSEWRDLNIKFILQVFRDITFLKAIKQHQDNLDRYQSLEYIDEDVDDDEDLYSRSTNQNVDKVFDEISKNNSEVKNKPLNGMFKPSDNENKPTKPRVKYISISSEHNIDDDLTYVKHGSILRQNSNPFVLSSQISHYGELMAEYETEVYDSERYLNDMYPVCRKLIDKMLAWDIDEDGVIENSGSADQTYDIWTMTGTSSYCGGMWLAALQCMQTMAALLGIQDDIKFFKVLLDKGKLSFEKKLWNGKFYEFDENNQIIMADQLCGQWYLRACGYQYSVFPKENVKTALKTIYENNVLKFGGGKMGAVNGFVPATADKPGHVDESSIQSKECWTGVTYGLASLMIYEGMMDEAMKTAGGLYETLSSELGMSFETPEALYETGKFRSLGYMRPLSIWGMHHAYNTVKNAVNR